MMFNVQTNIAGRRWWFAGSEKGMVGYDVVITPTIFGAYRFETKAEALEVVEEFGAGWEVGEIIAEGAA
jgi:hypothetical protein